MTIPVRNLYYLLAYAWDRLDEAGLVDVSDDDFTAVANLFGRVLAGGVARLVKRGLDRGYVERAEAIAGVRGKVRFAETVRGNLPSHGRAFCAFDDLTADVPHNRLVAQTVRDLLRVDGLDRRVAEALGDGLRRLGPMTPVDVRPALFGRVQLHGNNGFYRFLLDVCRLVHESVAVDEATGRRTFRDFRRDERAMARLFERFVRNFYRREQVRYTVASPHIDWAETDGSAVDLALLPTMRTDVVLTSPDRRIVVDAKYYTKTTQDYFGRGRIRSGHLYQLYAYLRNVDLTNPQPRASEGLLLYPQVDTAVAADLTIQGHRVRVRTIDLTLPWTGIAADMMGLIPPSQS